MLYEGYLLYPYRRSAIKNRQRWTFGVVYPQEYSEVQGGSEPWTMQTECLLTGQGNTLLDVRVRFLHLLVRTIMQPTTRGNERGEKHNGIPSPLQTGTAYSSEWSLASQFADEPWEEGMEREVSALNLSLTSLVAKPERVEIAFPSERIIEQGDQGEEIVLEQQPLTGAIIITAESVAEDLYKLKISIENNTTGTNHRTNRSDEHTIHRPPTLRSFVSTHTILQVRQGAFISLLEPPETLKTLAEGCQNQRTWPVLVGQEGECDTILSSPIILYDYPQIAPESPGSLFDGAEIDEILTLRILTLTDEEKQEMRQGDERAREILERTESITPEQFMKLHGVIRSLRPVAEEGDNV